MDQLEIHPYRRGGTAKDEQNKKTWKLPSWPPKARAFKWSQIGQGLIHHLPWAIFGFILGRGILFDELMPFGMAYLAAILAVARNRWPYVLPAILAGSLSVLQGTVLWANLLALLTLVPVIFTARIVEEKRNIYVPALVFANVVIAKTVVVVLSGPSFYQYMVILFEALASGGLTYVALLALPAVVKRFQGRSPAMEELMALAVMLGGVVVGLHGFSWGFISLQGVVSKFIVLLAGYLGGMGAGTVLGTLVGLIPSLSNLTAPLAVATYACGGLLAGVFRGFGRLGVAMGFILANIILSVYLGPGDSLKGVLGEAALAIGLFLALSVKLWKLPKEKNLPGHEAVEERVTEQQVMELTSQRIKEFARVFNELSRTFEQISTETQGRDLSNWQNLLQEITNQACDGCARYRLCWQKDFGKTNKIIMDMLTWIEVNGKLTTPQLSEEARKRCIRAKELVVVLNCLFDVYKTYRQWDKKLVESRGIVSGQLRGVSSIMNNIADEINLGEAGKVIPMAEQGKLTVELGVAKGAKDGSYISGDSYAWVNLRDGKMAIILSDGMGVGPRAAMESNATVSLLKQLMETGFDQDLAVKTVNSVLVLRSADETFATVDLAVIDMTSGETDFIKIGAAASFIKRGRKVGVIRSTSLPIGVFHSIEADTVNQTLWPGDWLVMVTDGVLDACRTSDGENWVLDLLKNYRGNEAQEIAEIIINQARIKAGNRIPDDMTVLAAKLKAYEKI
ncbi:MAG: SpoIIE family protein phosphatase [Thermincolia bacterium]